MRTITREEFAALADLVALTSDLRDDEIPLHERLVARGYASYLPCADGVYRVAVVHQ